jgi:CheY-like chemotaxis protein
VNQLVKFMQAHGIPLNGLDGGTLRVLIVDDDAAVRDELSAALESRGKYKVSAAGNGFEAGMQAEQFRPHVILLDLLLSDTDAKIVCQNIKRNPALAAAKVVALAGQLTSRQSEMLLSEGFDGCLCRPFEQTDLIRAIEQASNIIT